MNCKSLGQSSWVASLTTSLCQVWAAKCDITLPLWQQEEWSFYKHQGSWAEQESPLYLGEEVNQGQGQGQDKDPTQETKLSLFHLTNWQPRPQSSLRQSSQPGEHPKQMLHALASVIKKCQLSTHRTLDFKLHNFLVAPPRKRVVKLYPEWANFFYCVVNYKSIKC